MILYICALIPTLTGFIDLLGIKEMFMGGILFIGALGAMALMRPHLLELKERYHTSLLPIDVRLPLHREIANRLFTYYGNIGTHTTGFAMYNDIPAVITDWVDTHHIVTTIVERPVSRYIGDKEPSYAAAESSIALRMSRLQQTNDPIEAIQLSANLANPHLEAHVEVIPEKQPRYILRTQYINDYNNNRYNCPDYLPSTYFDRCVYNVFDRRAVIDIMAKDFEGDYQQIVSGNLTRDLIKFIENCFLVILDLTNDLQDPIDSNLAKNVLITHGTFTTRFAGYLCVKARKKYETGEMVSFAEAARNANIKHKFVVPVMELIDQGDPIAEIMYLYSYLDPHELAEGSLELIRYHYNKDPEKEKCKDNAEVFWRYIKPHLDDIFKHGKYEYM
jgi:hypothetical protein